MLYICEKFHNNISKVFNLQSGHKYMAEMAIFNVQRAITPKVCKPVMVRVFCMSSQVVLYICVKFCENILASIRVTERTKIMEALMDGHSNISGFRGYLNVKFQKRFRGYFLGLGANNVF